jgi:hypothetical protein
MTSHVTRDSPRNLAANSTAVVDTGSSSEIGRRQGYPARGDGNRDDGLATRRRWLASVGDRDEDLPDGCALDRVMSGRRVVEVEAVNRQAGLFADS